MSNPSQSRSTFGSGRVGSGTKNVLNTVSERRDKRGRRIGRNWWREYNCDILREAENSWQALKESGEAIMTTSVAGAEFTTGYYQLSEAEYRSIRPRPTLKAFLIQNAGMATEVPPINGHTGFGA